MATDFKVTGDTKQASQALKVLETDVKNVGTAAEQAGAKLAKMGSGGGEDDGLGPLRELSQQIADAGKQLDDLKNAGEAAGGEGAASLGKLLPVLGAVAAAAGVVGTAVSAVADIIKTAADSGNADAQRLVTAVEGIGTAWDDVQARIAATGTFTGLMEGLTGVTKEASTSVSAIGTLAAAFADLGAAAIKPESIAAIQQMTDKQLELNEARRQAGDFAKVQAGFEQRERQQRFAADAEQLTTLEEVNAALKKNFDAQQEAVNKGVGGGQTLVLYQEKQIALYRQQADLIREQKIAKDKAAADDARRAEKEAADEKKRKQDEADAAQKTAETISKIKQRYAEDDARRANAASDKQMMDELTQRRESAAKGGNLLQELASQEDSLRDAATTAEEVAATKRQAALDKAGTKEFQELDRIAREAQATADKLARAFEQAADRRVAATKRAAAAEDAARQKRVDELAGTDGIQNAAAGIMAQASDPQAIAKRLAQQAADAATQKAMDDDGEISRSEQRDINKAKMAAHRQAIEQSRGGYQAFSDDQIQGAIDANAQAQVSALQAAGQTTDDAVAALGKVIGLSQAFGQKQQMQQQAIDQMSQMIDVMWQSYGKQSLPQSSKTWGAKGF